MARVTTSSLSKRQFRGLILRRARDAKQGRPNRQGMRSLSKPEQLFVRRHALGISTREAAKQIGVSAMSIFFWEHGIGRMSRLEEWLDQIEAETNRVGGG